MSLDTIRQPISAEMKGFEPFFRGQLKSPNPILALVVNHILRSKGKQMRPMLVFLAAKATGGVAASTNAAAALIELLHTASLVHDDVVDETYQRRGQFSVNALWNTKVAVLVGDFFLARGLQIALEGNHYDILRIVCDAVKRLSEGELLQIEHARKFDITEETYYEIINKKTATLIAACTKAGAHSSGSDEQTVEALYNYGINLGMAFQIRDDIFDYERTGIFGKPSGNDIKERKMTLPIIYALHNAPAAEAHKMLKQIKHNYKDDKTVAAATAFAHQWGGMDYARERMLYYANKAKADIAFLPDSEAKESLMAMVDYNTIRNR